MLTPFYLKTQIMERPLFLNTQNRLKHECKKITLKYTNWKTCAFTQMITSQTMFIIFHRKFNTQNVEHSAWQCVYQICCFNNENKASSQNRYIHSGTKQLKLKYMYVDPPQGNPFTGRLVINLSEKYLDKPLLFSILSAVMSYHQCIHVSKVKVWLIWITF